MGILTLLRNAFGRSRKGRTAEAEGAEQAPAQEPAPTAAQQPEPKVPAPATESAPTVHVPDPRPSDGDEHELVSAAFGNVTVPKPSDPVDPTAPAAETPTPTEPETAAAEEKSEPEPTQEPAAENPTPTAEPAAAEPKSEPTPEPTAAEPEAEPEPAAAQAEPEAEPEPTPEPVAEATPEFEPTPEPQAEATPEPETEATPEPAPKPQAEATPEPETEAEPQTEPEPTPAPQAEAKPEAEAEPQAEPEPKSESEPQAEAGDPQAADGEEAPQGPPALDDESRTGGAGGNDLAEGEAEAEPTTDQPPSEQEPAATEPTPEPAAATPQTEAGDPQAADGEEAPQGPPALDDESRTGGAGGNDPAEGEAETETEAETEPAAEQPAPDTDPTPATPLTHIDSHAPALTTAYQSAASALAKFDLTGTRAKVYLVLDRSASMRPYYKDGSAQALGEQTLALASHLDPEATVQVVFFSTEVDGTGELTLAEHENRIDDLHGSLGRMGRTSYHAAVDAVLGHRAESADDPATPTLVIFQTDGAPDAKTPATKSLTDASKKHPTVFFSFVAFGEHDNKAFDYLRKLKTDTTSFFHAGPTPRELTDQELYEGVLANWRP
ncbi:VWA domain-containing protein [Streptomyces cyslabdanicus]|uniref:VWA domain-containing protein n=1 Tax=Streptomyces cyslabdanicus TaxID=1470456 RepID=UPI004044D769